jgi:hypothetical protein
LPALQDAGEGGGAVGEDRGDDLHGGRAAQDRFGRVEAAVDAAGDRKGRRD